MVAFKTMATHRLMVLLFVFLFENSFHLLPADAASSAGWIDDLFLPVALLLTNVPSATILLSVLVTKPDKVSPRWNKVRALLLLAIGFSAASTFLAVISFEFGFRYRRGRATDFFGLPAWVPMLFIMGLKHGLCAGFLMAQYVRASP